MLISHKANTWTLAVTSSTASLVVRKWDAITRTHTIMVNGVCNQGCASSASGWATRTLSSGLGSKPPCRSQHGQDSTIILKKFFFNYSHIVDLQCCVNFCCTANLFSYTYIYTYICIYILFHIDYFSIMVYHRTLNIIPCAYTLGPLLFIFF